MRSVDMNVVDPNYAEMEITLAQTRQAGACHGDSGGPVFARTNGRLLLTGIISEGVSSKGGTGAMDCSAPVTKVTSVIAHGAWIRKAEADLLAETPN